MEECLSEAEQEIDFSSSLSIWCVQIIRQRLEIGIIMWMMMKREVKEWQI